MECNSCKKDLTNTTYKIKFRNKVVCYVCYRKIPYAERVSAINKSKGR